MKTAYREIVKKWENEYDYDVYVFRDYYLTDFNNDGSADLLVKAGDSYAGTLTYVYTYKNGNILELGYAGGDETYCAYPGHNGIVKEGAHTGGNWVWLSTYKKGKIAFKQLASKEVESYSDFFNIRARLKSHSRWKNGRYVPNYEDLK